ncbi:hypothetical protein N7513_003407 [Penicillium frequentans]|nr:hypothetical protein N7513_003407 [Penicillium glabrum]
MVAANSYQLIRIRIRQTGLTTSRPQGMMEIEVSDNHLSAQVPSVQRRAEHREGFSSGFTHPGPVCGGHTNLAGDIDIVNIHRSQGGANGERAQISRVMPH